MRRMSLGVATSDADAARNVLIWCSVTIVVLVAAMIVLAGLRKRYRKAWDDRLEPGSFEVQELEKLRSGGRISDAEFRVLRRKVMGLEGSGGEKGGGGLSTPPKVDEEHKDAGA